MTDNKSKYFFENFNLAEAFCNGDKEKAKKLLNGQFHDIIVIKGRFDSDDEEIYGFFLIFISRIFYSVVLNYTVFTNYTNALMNKPINDWKSFYNKISKVMQEEEHDLIKDKELNQVIRKIISMKTAIGIIEDINNNSIQTITNKFKEIFSKALLKDGIDVDLDYEDTSSLDLNKKWGFKPPDKENL